MIRAGLVVILALALALGYALWGKSRADNRADRAQEAAERTAAQLRDTTAALETERGHTQRLHEIAAKHEKDKADAEAAADRTIAGLRAGTVQLRQHWQGCVATSRLSAAESAAGFADDAARLRAEGAGALVRLADQCDAQVRGLQAVVMADREVR